MPARCSLAIQTKRAAYRPGQRIGIVGNDRLAAQTEDEVYDVRPVPLHPSPTGTSGR